ncbi:MAG: serine hydrolase [Rhizomicrobium sp.]
MGLKDTGGNAGKIDALVAEILHAARIPGGAVAVVADGATVFAKGYGYRDLAEKLPLTEKTAYPIASTTKAFNATLIGMLVDDGLLGWDVPVQSYLSDFRLWDAAVSSQVTLRDLIVMRTGLPRHDWVWDGRSLDRAGLVERMRFLEPSVGFRERYQYNNLSVVASGHVAEKVAGICWEELVRRRILTPLGMHDTAFGVPGGAEVTLSYRENNRRELIAGSRRSAEATAPSGGSLYSTVLDMARWVKFNLDDGRAGERSLVKSATLAEIHAPQITGGSELVGLLSPISYAMGWVVGAYHGRPRLTHGGHLHDVNSVVSLFPKDGIGIVSVTNFGGPVLAPFIAQRTFDVLMGFEPLQHLDELLAQYEKNITDTRERNRAAPHVENTRPSHALDAYAGVYAHPAYGEIRVEREGGILILNRDGLRLSLRHWHYDVWVAAESEMFVIYMNNPFDPSNCVQFHSGVGGNIESMAIRFEPALASIVLRKA